MVLTKFILSKFNF